MLKAYGVVIVVVLLICTIIGAVCWPYTINSWLEYAGKEPSVVWWHGALLGFCPVLGQITIPAAIGTWILMLFL